MPARVLCGKRAFEGMTMALWKSIASAGRVLFCRRAFFAVGGLKKVKKK